MSSSFPLNLLLRIPSELVIIAFEELRSGTILKNITFSGELSGLGSWGSSLRALIDKRSAHKGGPTKNEFRQVPNSIFTVWVNGSEKESQPIYLLIVFMRFLFLAFHLRNKLYVKVDSFISTSYSFKSYKSVLNETAHLVHVSWPRFFFRRENYLILNIHIYIRTYVYVYDVYVSYRAKLVIPRSLRKSQKRK